MIKQEVRELVKYTKDVGYAGWGSMVRTDVIGIRHSKKGGHMFPVHPNENDKKNKKVEGNKKVSIAPMVRYLRRYVAFRDIYNIQTLAIKVKSIRPN